MKIIQVITPSRVSGAELIVLALCRGLAAHGHTVWLVTKAGSPLIPVAEEAGIHTVPMAIGGKGNIVAPGRIARFAREQGAELIHTHLSTASQWGTLAGRLAGIPAVATVHALNTRWSYHFAHRLVAVSEAVKQHLVGQGVSAERIEVVYNGLDLHRFTPTANLADAKRNVGIAPAAPVIGVIAHLSKKKGHAWLLTSVARLLPSFPGLRVLLLGTGPEREALATHAARLGFGNQVIFAGYQPDVVPWIAAMDVLVLPPIAKEGLGCVLLEAGAMEKPVIASRIGGTSEVVAQDETGLLVPVGDVSALAEALALLLRDPDLRRRMGQAARRRALTLFSEEEMIANYERVYARLCPRPGIPA